MRVHDFREKLAEGERSENVIDEFFRARGVEIRPASQNEQRDGIDRWFKIEGVKETAVEYKADARTEATGNLFVELISNSTTGKLGWLYTSRADVLVYRIGPSILKFRMDKFRSFVLERLGQFRVGCAKNREYFSLGALVPSLDVLSIAKTEPLG